jgi:hypothetical protein
LTKLDDDNDRMTKKGRACAGWYRTQQPQEFSRLAEFAYHRFGSRSPRDIFAFAVVLYEMLIARGHAQYIYNASRTAWPPLGSSKGPIEVVVIDSVQKPSED